MSDGQPPLDKLSIVVHGGYFDKIHYALVMAAAAAAIGRPVTLFFTMGACHALKTADSNGNPAWRALPLSEEDRSGGAANGGERGEAYTPLNGAPLAEPVGSRLPFRVTFLVWGNGLLGQGL